MALGGAVPLIQSVGISKNPGCQDNLLILKVIN